MLHKVMGTMTSFHFQASDDDEGTIPKPAPVYLKAQTNSPEYQELKFMVNSTETREGIF